ncbi:N-acetylmuramoyl-L-alanine amidase, partial [Myxococcota bacterium]|nr:N-acetylmuramoyl-L-alanine amidase [Myxococcota bacterium]
HLSSEGPADDTVVVADAVRLGGGMGTADFGGGISNTARWLQSAEAWAREEEVPSWVWEGVSDVRVRPSMALWQDVDLYLSFHTNAFNTEARGTETYSYSTESYTSNPTTSVPPGTRELSASVQGAIVEELRENWDPNWQDRGTKGAYFGELRPFRDAWLADSTVSIPAVLVEAAFHDNSLDAAYLRDDHFRFDLARAMVRGIIRYVASSNSTSLMMPPRPPLQIRTQLTEAGISLSWAPVSDPVDGSAAVATHYRVQLSADGTAFKDLIRTTETSILLEGLTTCDTYAFRVLAENAGGLSMPSRTAIAKVGQVGPRVLWVDGDKRLQRMVWQNPEEPMVAARVFDILNTVYDNALSAESVSVQDISSGLVSLSDYDVVWWTVGETSSGQTTLDEGCKGAIRTYLDGGGNLVISGAEIGWDLCHLGSDDDKSFFNNYLHATYNADDAQTYSVGPASDASYLSQLPALSFDDGRGRTYGVEYPDVLSPFGDATLELAYSTTSGAATYYSGAHKVFLAGFPIETINESYIREELIDKVLKAMTGAPLSVSCGLPYSNTVLSDDSIVVPDDVVTYPCDEPVVDPIDDPDDPVDDPVVDDPVVDDPVIDDPVIDDPVVDDPTPAPPASTPSDDGMCSALGTSSLFWLFSILLIQRRRLRGARA